MARPAFIDLSDGAEPAAERQPSERSMRRMRAASDLTDRELEHDLAYEGVTVQEITADLAAAKNDPTVDQGWRFRAMWARRLASTRLSELGRELSKRRRKTQAEFFVLAAKEMIKERDMKKIWASAQHRWPNDPAWEGGIEPRFVGGKKT